MFIGLLLMPETNSIVIMFPVYLFQALEYFMKLLQDLDTVCSFSLDPSLEAALLFVVKFQKSQPDLVARAHLQVDLQMFLDLI